MAAQDLVDMDEARAFLNKDALDETPEMATLITAASDWIEQLTGRKLKERAFSNLRLTSPHSEKLYLPAWPINTGQTITITLDDVVQTLWKTEASGKIDDFDVLIASDDPWDDRWGLRNHFYRRNGWQSALSWGWPNAQHGFDRHRLLLTYTGGYAPVPTDLKQACLYLVQKLWRDSQKQLTGIAALAIPQGGTVSFPQPEPTVPRETWMLIQPYKRGVAAFAGT